MKEMTGDFIELCRNAELFINNNRILQDSHKQELRELLETAKQSARDEFIWESDDYFLCLDEKDNDELKNKIQWAIRLEDVGTKQAAFEFNQGESCDENPLYRFIDEVSPEQIMRWRGIKRMPGLEGMEQADINTAFAGTLQMHSKKWLFPRQQAQMLKGFLELMDQWENAREYARQASRQLRVQFQQFIQLNLQAPAVRELYYADVSNDFETKLKHSLIQQLASYKRTQYPQINALVEEFLKDIENSLPDETPAYRLRQIFLGISALDENLAKQEAYFVQVKTEKITRLRKIISEHLHIIQTKSGPVIRAQIQSDLDQDFIKEKIDNLKLELNTFRDNRKTKLRDKTHDDENDHLNLQCQKIEDFLNGQLTDDKTLVEEKISRLNNYLEIIHGQVKQNGSVSIRSLNAKQLKQIIVSHQRIVNDYSFSSRPVALAIHRSSTYPQELLQFANATINNIRYKQHPGSRTIVNLYRRFVWWLNSDKIEKSVKDEVVKIRNAAGKLQRQYADFSKNHQDIDKVGLYSNTKDLFKILLKSRNELMGLAKDLQKNKKGLAAAFNEASIMLTIVNHQIDDFYLLAKQDTELFNSVREELYTFIWQEVFDRTWELTDKEDIRTKLRGLDEVRAVKKQDVFKSDPSAEAKCRDLLLFLQDQFLHHGSVKLQGSQLREIVERLEFFAPKPLPPRAQVQNVISRSSSSSSLPRVLVNDIDGVTVVLSSSQSEHYRTLDGVADEEDSDADKRSMTGNTGGASPTRAASPTPPPPPPIDVGAFAGEEGLSDTGVEPPPPRYVVGREEAMPTDLPTSLSISGAPLPPAPPTFFQPPPPPPKTVSQSQPPLDDGRKNLLNSIVGGIKLKKVVEKEKVGDKAKSSTNGAITDALQRRVASQGVSEEDKTSVSSAPSNGTWA